MKVQGYKAEITAFLSLLFILLISFVGAMIESASIQVLKNHKRADTSLALESVFAEYKKELLEEYDIFALDGTYETGRFDESVIESRLSYYGADEAGNEIKKSEFLTDSQGRVFYEQAVRYIENKIGIDGIQKEKEEAAEWETQEENAENQEKEEETTQEELESILGEAEESLPEEDNPIQSIANLKKSSLLSLVVPNQEQLSNKSIEQQDVASKRELREGRGTFAEREKSNEVLGKVFFNEYLLGHFDDFTEHTGEKALDYELEYLIGGSESDQKNLETVLKKIQMIRFAANYGYLLTDQTKKAEAEALALTLCALLTVPGVTEIVKHAILLAWSYGESIMDLRILASKGKVPAVKTAETWKLSLSGLLKLGKEEIKDGDQGYGEGMTYRDYLKGLLVLEKKEKLSMHALDLIECNLHIKTDTCITKLEIESICTLRRGVQYRFMTYFGYQ